MATEGHFKVLIFVLLSTTSAYRRPGGTVRPKTENSQQPGWSQRVQFLRSQTPFGDFCMLAYATCATTQAGWKTESEDCGLMLAIGRAHIHVPTRATKGHLRSTSSRVSSTNMCQLAGYLSGV